MALRASTTDMALRLTLDRFEDRLEENSRAYAAAQWSGHFGQTGDALLSYLEQARATLLCDDQARAWLQRQEGELDGSELGRRVTLLLRRFARAAVESRPDIYRLRNRIDHTIAGHSLSIEGMMLSRVERSRILRGHPERDVRRAAWLATGTLAGRIQADVRRLMCLRQERAREQGYDGFVAWALDSAGLNRAWVEQFLAALRLLTDAAYRAWLDESAQRLSLPELRPWDLAFAAEQRSPWLQTTIPLPKLVSAVHRAAAGLGLGEAAAGVRVKVADVPYAAICYPVAPPRDVRILLSPRDGETQGNTLFHEFGHALHWRCVGPVSPVLRWESPPFNEGMAYLWERMASEPDWLMEHRGFSLEQAASHRRLQAQRSILWLRAMIARCAFEYRAYDVLDQDPNSDLVGLYREIHTEHLHVPFEDAPGWADGPFWTSHPVYWQNYLVGQAIAAQTLAALRKKFGRLIGRPEVGAWLLRCYYAPGASIPWREKLSRATGASLSTAALAADLGVAGQRCA